MCLRRCAPRDSTARPGPESNSLHPQTLFSSIFLGVEGIISAGILRGQPPLTISSADNCLATVITSHEASIRRGYPQWLNRRKTLLFTWILRLGVTRPQIEGQWLVSVWKTIHSKNNSSLEIFTTGEEAGNPVW